MLCFGRLGRGFAGRDVPPVTKDVQFGKIYIRIDGDDDELEKLSETLLARKATVRGEIVTKPWGLRDLTVEDPDGVSDWCRHCTLICADTAAEYNCLQPDGEGV